MKANLLLYDYPLNEVDNPGGACIRYSKPEEKTFATLKALLEGFDTIIVYTYEMNEIVWNLFRELAINQKKLIQLEIKERN